MSKLETHGEVSRSDANRFPSTEEVLQVGLTPGVSLHRALVDLAAIVRDLRMRSEINGLANFIMAEVPGEPSRSEGAGE